MLIHTGTPYEHSIVRTDPHRHKYGSAMAEYLDYMQGEVPCQMWTGEADAPMGHVAQFGRRLLLTDSRGFVSVDTYLTAEDAAVVMDALDDWYTLWSGAVPRTDAFVGRFDVVADSAVTL